MLCKRGAWALPDGGKRSFDIPLYSLGYDGSRGWWFYGMLEARVWRSRKCSSSI